MNVCQDWFSFVKATPIISNENFIANSVCNCLTCHPFRKVTNDILNQHRATAILKPSQEVKTISSLVDKFSIGRPSYLNDGINRFQTTTTTSTTTTVGNFNLKKTFNKHHTCNNRNRNFNIEMKHEKFTPCELSASKTHCYQDIKESQSSYVNDCDERRMISSEITITPIMKISSTRVISANNLTMRTNYEQSDVIVVPPRRKKRSTIINKQFTNSNTNTNTFNSTDISIESNSDLETRNNCRNIELNNLDRPPKPKRIMNCYNTNNNNRNNDNDNDNKNNRNHQLLNDTCSNEIKNTKINNNNNKSGCSSVDVVSASLEKNIFNQNIINNRSDNVTATTTAILNSIQKDKCNKAMKSSNLIGYSQNKVYYKDNANETYENCLNCGKMKNSNSMNDEIDEILVCESIISFEHQEQQQQTQSKSQSSSPPPKNSTYTKFCTDSFYYDKDDEDDVSSSSFESQFEQINRLRTECSLLSSSPFTRFRVRKSHQKRTRHSSLIKEFELLPSVHRTLEERTAITTLTGGGGAGGEGGGGRASVVVAAGITNTSKGTGSATKTKVATVTPAKGYHSLKAFVRSPEDGRNSINSSGLNKYHASIVCDFKDTELSVLDLKDIQ